MISLFLFFYFILFLLDLFYPWSVMGLSPRCTDFGPLRFSLDVDGTLLITRPIQAELE